MSKKYKGKSCVYCVSGVAAVADHVFAREFFLPARRANLPKVPACHTCNDVKGRLEHYLTAILGFGARHADASANLVQMVPGRLAKNTALHRVLNDRRGHIWAREGSLVVPAMTLPIDGDKIEELFRFIVKGLMWHHWGVRLSSNTGVWAGCLNQRGVEVHRELLNRDARDRASENLGNSTFTYEGAQGTDIPQMSIWLFSIYGGIKLSGDRNDAHEVTSFIGGVTATKQTLAKMDELGITSSAGTIRRPSPIVRGPITQALIGFRR